MTAHSDADFDVSRDALIATGGNIARAAERLGISQPTLSMRLKRHPELWPDGIDRRKRGRPLRGDVAVVEAAVDLVRRADEPAPQIGRAHV